MGERHGCTARRAVSHRLPYGRPAGAAAARLLDSHINCLQPASRQAASQPPAADALHVDDRLRRLRCLKGVPCLALPASQRSPVDDPSTGRGSLKCDGQLASWIRTRPTLPALPPLNWLAYFPLLIAANGLVSISPINTFAGLSLESFPDGSARLLEPGSKHDGPRKRLPDD